MSENLYQQTISFLTNLAYSSRVTLPFLVMCGFLLTNISLSLELSLDTEYVYGDDLLNSDSSGGNDSVDGEIFLDGNSENGSDSDVIIRTIICVDIEMDRLYPVSS